MPIAPPSKQQRPITAKTCLKIGIYLLLMWGAWYLAARGFSRYWREQLKTELQQYGLTIAVRRITLNPFEGLVANDVHLRLLDQRQTPILFINRAALNINFFSFFSHKKVSLLKAIDLHNAHLTLPLDLEDPEGPKVRLRHLQARIYFQKHAIHLSQFEGQWNDMKISISARIQHPELYSSILQRLDSTHLPLSQQQEARAHRRALTSAIVHSIEQAHFKKPIDHSPAAQLNLFLNGDLARVEELNLQATFQSHCSFNLTLPAALAFDSSNQSFVTYQFQSANVEFEMTSQRLQLKRAYLTDTKGKMEIEGEYLPSSNQFTFNLESDGFDLVSLAQPFTVYSQDKALPNALKKFQLIQTPDLKLSGHLTPGNPFLFDLTGHLRLGQSQIQDITINRLETDFSWSNQNWYIRNFYLQKKSHALGSPAPVDPEVCEADILQSNDQFHLKLKSTLDPTDFASLVPEKARSALSEWQFNTLPQINITMHGAKQWNDWEHMQIEGRLHFGQGRFRGTKFNQLDSLFQIQNRLISCKNVYVARDEGSATIDQLIVDLNRYEVRLENLKSSVFPNEIAIWIDRDLVKVLAPYRFIHPPQAVTNGVVQFHGGRKSNLNIQFSTNEGLHYNFLKKELTFPKISGLVHFTDDRLELINLAAEIFGGKLQGMLDLDLRKKAILDYHAAIQMQNVDMVRLTKLYFDYDDSKGLLSGNYQWTGHGDDAGSMHGEGHAEVNQGNVFSLPIFGPLSSLMNNIIPGFGFEIAHQATGDFTIANGKILNPNLDIRGRGFSMLGRGWLGFLNDTMDYQVRMNANGVIGTMLYPVSRLLQYTSTGPLHKPIWKAKAFEISPLKKRKSRR